MANDILSRRNLFGTLLGALGAGSLQAAQGSRSLVAVYFSGGFDVNDLLSSNVPNLRALYDRGLAALVKGVPDGEPVQYLEGGAVAHRLSAVLNPNAQTLILRGAVAATPLDGRTLESASALRQADLATEFPASPLGKHLNTVARAIGGGNGPTLYTVLATGFRGQGEFQARRLAEIDAALGAFYAALEETGQTRNVTLFTDVALASDKRARSSSVRLVLGGGVWGRQQVAAASPDQIEAALCTWAGASPADLSRTYRLPAGPALEIF